MRQSIHPQILSIIKISYQIILPAFIFFGIIFSLINLVVLNSRALKPIHVNKYFVILSTCDLFIFILSIPTVISLNGCQIYYYPYFIHGVNTFFYVVQTFSLYNIFLITYDRYLAIYEYEYFNIIKKSKKKFIERILLTFILSVILHIDPLINIEVYCQDLINNNVTTCSSSSSSSSSRWIINDGLSNDENENPKMVAWIIRGLFVCAIPLLTIIFLNCIIICGVIKTKIQDRHGNRAKNIILAFTCSFIIFNFPVLIHAAVFGKNVDNCHGSFEEEIFRSIANFLLLFDHLSRIFFLFFHVNYLDVLKSKMGYCC